MAIHDVNATELIHRTAQQLEKEKAVQPPSWSQFVRTGTSKDRVPVQENWWFIRSASIMRKLFIFGPVGTSKLRVKYGSKKNRGAQPEKFFPASGNHLRKILQQLEKSGLAKQVEKGVHKGRVLTPKGIQLMDGIASEIMKEKGVTLPAIPKNVDLKGADEAPKKKKKKTTRKRKTTKKAKPKAEKVKVPATKEKTVEKPVEAKPETPKVEEKKAEEKPAEAPKEEPKAEETTEPKEETEAKNE